MSLLEIKVPDMGDFNDVEVIEILVKPGERIEVEQALLVLESDKASMEVPSSHAGIVKELKIKLGDRIGTGSLILLLEASSSATTAGAAGQTAEAISKTATPAANTSAPAPIAATAQTTSSAANKSTASAGNPKTSAPSQLNLPTGTEKIVCDLLVLGAGPGGYSAAFRAADLGLSVILVERYDTLGGVCLNVGCIPSKALLHTTGVLGEVNALAAHGITFGKPTIDLPMLRGFKEKVVGKLTSGLAGMARARKVEVIHGLGKFSDAWHLEVNQAGTNKVVQFKQAIIAAGSQAVSLPFLPKDPRIVDSTGALELREIPKRMLVIGGGIIGLEMATVYAALGAAVDIVEMADNLMLGADRDLVKVWEKYNRPYFGQIMLKTRTVSAQAKDDGIHMQFEKVDDANSSKNGEPAANNAVSSAVYDLVLVAVGRQPNGKRIAAEQAGINVDERGFIAVDKQQRTNIGHIFAIGDIVGQPMLAHKAVHEAHVAAEVAAGQKRYFDANQIPSVAYTNPEIAWAGLSEEQCKQQGIAYTKSVFPWAASGRAIANGRDEGFTKLLFDQTTHRIIGGGIVGTHAGDLIGEIALAIEMGADAVDIGRTIHPHPTLSESIGMAAEVFEGICTDLPPQKKHN